LYRYANHHPGVSMHLTLLSGTPLFSEDMVRSNSYLDFCGLGIDQVSGFTGAAQCLGSLYKAFGERITSGLVETSSIVGKLLKASEVHYGASHVCFAALSSSSIGTG
jgi:hypothetical protein